MILDLKEVTDANTTMWKSEMVIPLVLDNWASTVGYETTIKE